ncbi:Alpha/Beta hydrolase protein [Xylariales sp. PMI_506]|nr:Alpha/Beta hydrolase protein [Xylariales sp. PMI_506]
MIYKISRAIAVGASLVAAQFPNITPNLTTITSPVDSSIKISYKIPTGACATTVDSQEQYTGWVNVPGTSYPTNIFFWFVGAQEPTSALTIWLNGGPGSSSMFGFFSETGPCEVVDAGLEDKYSTVAREWGWDRASNMLFIDQPNQVGFSYDIPTQGSLDLVTGEIYIPPTGVPDSTTPELFLNGTFSSMLETNTANTTETAAVAIWHMLQGFLSAFPQFNPPDTSAVGVNLFAESYGGTYGPVFASKWEELNAERANGSLADSTLDIRLTSLGIVNGCIDDLIQAPYYPIMAINNTYGLETISLSEAEAANASFYQDGGCQDMIQKCRTLVASSDPDDTGAVENVATTCSIADRYCSNEVMGAYGTSGRSYYDIAAILPSDFPSPRYISYVNSAPFQEAIGTVLNYTETNLAVNSAFAGTGDIEREDLVPKLAALLDAGVRVGFMYGDRDYICNWLGGEAVSLAVSAAASDSSAYSGFPDVGYAPIAVNDSYVGGLVRQIGNLSFSRVFQAGHYVPAYQPETAFQVFSRIIAGTAIADGQAIDLSTYNTSAASAAAGDVWEQLLAIGNGTGTVDGDVAIINGALYTGSPTDFPTGGTATATETAAASSSNPAASHGPPLAVGSIFGALWISWILHA